MLPTGRAAKPSAKHREREQLLRGLARRREELLPMSLAK
jgi:hypothetical protein